MIQLPLPTGPLQLVCLGAHPDDIEIGCGGTLLSLAASREIAATVVVATGTVERCEEAEKAAPRFLGADVETRLLGLRDGHLPTQWGAVKEALQAVARTRSADIVFTPRLDDAHQDHRTIAEITPTVWRDAVIMRYEIPKWDGDFGAVTHYVPLKPDIARRKVALLDETFPSQIGREWWDSETFLGLLRLRGVECRHRYAEGFVVDKTIVSVD